MFLRDLVSTAKFLSRLTVSAAFPSAVGAALLSSAFCVTGGGPGQRAISQQPKQQESLQASGNMFAGQHMMQCSDST